MNMIRPICMLAVAVCAACTPLPDAEERNASALLASVQATTFGRDSVQFTLQVTNVADRPLELEYVSGQTFEFVVTPAGGGAEIWRWSSEMMFTQALRTETLGAGETQTHTVMWSPPAEARGEFVVHGALTAQNVTAEQATPFRLD